MDSIFLLYEKVETLKIKKASNKDYLQILKTVYASYPNEWLVCMNIYEIIFNDSSLKDEITFLRNGTLLYKLVKFACAVMLIVRLF